MYPPAFDYLRAESVEEALDLLSDTEDAELLAGGHSLLPTIKSGLADPGTLIDVGGIDDLSGVETTEEGVWIGATTTYADALKSETLAERAPAVADAIGEIGDVQVRNRGTVGGNVAHADPASDLPGPLLAADATVHVRGADGERSIPIDDYFLAMYATAIEEGEIVTGIEIPACEGSGAYVKKTSPSSGYAVVGVGVRLAVSGGEIESARVGANGAFGYGRRLGPVEEFLAGETIDGGDVAAEAGERATADVEEWELIEDIDTSSEFRGRLLEAYAERAVDRALDRAG
ncbi:FAD binding domain-containing protein [Saliphagus infecundisoli]|uniref:FAD binding domain-containing protein n=1 Tax=Saliphagus infecundisoli TaxID=1849069 RepID=A0ABD5QGK3_9EURY|nr:xanthine dehydrogenase family protein subunit M [Saliphagus infecundisoli]